MNARSTIQLLTAPSRTGKTYLEVRWLVEEFLPEKSGCYWCNLPLHVEALAAYVADKTGRPAEEFAKRIKIIPDEEMLRWKEGETGPWDYFAAENLSGAFITIDEIHNFAGEGHKPNHLHAWSKFLGEAGHMGCKFRFITQDQDKVAKQIKREAASYIELINQEDNRDPWFGIYCADWYEIRAKLFRMPYLATVIWVEKRKVLGRWTEMERKPFIRWPKYFPLYNSYSKPIESGQAGKPEPRAYEVYGWPKFLWFIFKRSPIQITARLLFAVFIVYLINGGGGTLMKFWMDRSMAAFRMPKGGQAQHKEHATTKPVVTRPLQAVTGTPGQLHPSAPDPLLQEMKKKLEEHEKREAERAALVMLAPDRIGLRHGGIYRTGEKIDRGPHDGKTVIWVDIALGACGLSDGTLLRITH